MKKLTLILAVVFFAVTANAQEAPKAAKTETKTDMKKTETTKKDGSKKEMKETKTDKKEMKTTDAPKK